MAALTDLALRAAEEMRETLDREELEDVVVRVVRWHDDPVSGA